MARTFSPSKHKGGNDGAYLEVAGEYLLAGRTLKRDKNRNSKPYLYVRFEVIAGPLKEKGFKERIYINDEALWKVAQDQGAEAIFHIVAKYVKGPHITEKVPESAMEKHEREYGKKLLAS